MQQETGEEDGKEEDTGARKAGGADGEGVQMTDFSRGMDLLLLLLLL